MKRFRPVIRCGAKRDRNVIQLDSSWEYYGRKLQLLAGTLACTKSMQFIGPRLATPTLGRIKCQGNEMPGCQIPSYSNELLPLPSCVCCCSFYLDTQLQLLGACPQAGRPTQSDCFCCVCLALDHIVIGRDASSKV